MLNTITNREKLVQELAATDDETFTRIIAFATDQAVGHLMCRDCEAEHGGECPRADDEEPCEIDFIDWFRMPCTREHLLDEIREKMD